MHTAQPPQPGALGKGYPADRRRRLINANRSASTDRPRTLGSQERTRISRRGWIQALTAQIRAGKRHDETRLEGAEEGALPRGSGEEMEGDRRRDRRGRWGLRLLLSLLRSKWGCLRLVCIGGRTVGPGPRGWMGPAPLRWPSDLAIDGGR